MTIPVFPRTLPVFAASLALVTGFLGCEVHDPHHHNEQEVFTTVRLEYANAADASDKPVATIKFKEGFGHGGDALEKNDTIHLKAGAEYAVDLVLLDESKSPAVVMSEEVEEEGAEHQVFYTPEGAALTVTVIDKDSNGRPLGLETSQKTGAAGKGTLKVTLKHQPKLKSDASTILTGETDVEVSFHVVIR